MSENVEIIIKKCSFKGSVKSDFNSAGFIGGIYTFSNSDPYKEEYNVKIEDSYFIGSVCGKENTLTISGIAIGSNVEINNSYFVGSMKEVIGNYDAIDILKNSATDNILKSELSYSVYREIRQEILIKPNLYSSINYGAMYVKYSDVIEILGEYLSTDKANTIIDLLQAEAENIDAGVLNHVSYGLFIKELSDSESSSTWPDINIGNNCYFNSSLVDINNTDINDTWQLGRTTSEMTQPIDLETTYKDWIFDDTKASYWSVLENFNNGYPFLNVITPVFLDFYALSNINIDKLDTGFSMKLEVKTTYKQELEPWFPIVRTNLASRIDDGAFTSGTLLRTGPYEKELWEGDIEGFFEYVATTQTFDDLAVQDTMPIRLPVKSVEVTSVNITEDISVGDNEIFIEEIPDEWQIQNNDYKYLSITDGDRVEKIGYGLTEERVVDESTVYVIGEIDRGIQNSGSKNFTADGNTVVYTSYLTQSLTWDDEITPLGKRTEYIIRAGIEVDTKLSTTGERITFRFYGGERKLGIDESEPPTGMEMGELFIDARDLEFEDELFDRAKLKFEEMEFETWNLEEFKEWTWEEFKDIKTPQFSTMTLEELIKIAAGITDYTERDLVNNYNRDQIETIIRNKLDVVTADEIDGWSFNVSRLVARLLTGEPAGAYDNWTETEVKDFLKTMLTNEFNFTDFEDNFPFDKWENIMKSRLEININNNASIEVEYNQYGPYNYGVDFQLGDIIVVEYPEVFRAMIRIIEVKEEYTQEGKKYTLTLGKEFENLVSKIKADKDSISGRL